MNKLVYAMKEIDGLRHVNRWNGFFAFDRSNIAEHTFRVSWWASFITDQWLESFGDPTINKHELYACVQRWVNSHDFGEKYTGDVRHDVKREWPELKAILDRVEDSLLQSKIPFIDKLKLDYSPEVRMLAKAIYKGADVLDFTFEALKELRKGNDENQYPVAILRGLVGVRALGNEGIIDICEVLYNSLLGEYSIDYTSLKENYGHLAEFHSEGINS